MFKIDKYITELTTEELGQFIKKHKENSKNYKLLEGYYLGKYEGEVKNPFARYITDMHVGYFMGNPVSYSCEDENVNEKLNEIFYNSNEKEENYELARICSIKGKAYELIYTDENAEIKFNELQPESCFLIYDTTIQENVIGGVRLFDDIVEFYTKTSKKTYKYKDGEFTLLVDELNIFGDVPIIEYLNNKDGQGDFEQVIDLINAYNTVQVGTLRDMTDFTDAYLKLVNLNGTTKEDIEKMKKDKVLLLDENGNADWLIKNVNDNWVENYKNRVKNDIHKFSYTPDMTDENFGNNLSGVSIRYKILAMEQLRNNKQRKFEISLQKRLDLIFKVLNLTSGIEKPKIKITFNNSLPQNILELSTIITSLSNFLPIETLIEQLPFVENAKEELDKKSKEVTDRYNSYEEQSILDK